MSLGRTDMPDHLGADTRDLRALGQPHPAETGLQPDETDTNTRRIGRRCRRIGLTTLAATYAGTFITAIAADNYQMFHQPEAQLFAVLGLVTAIVIGAVFLAVGLHERNQ